MGGPHELKELLVCQDSPFTNIVTTNTVVKNTAVILWEMCDMLIWVRVSNRAQELS